MLPALFLLVSFAACSIHPLTSKEKLLTLDDDVFFETMMHYMDQPNGLPVFSAAKEQKPCYTLMNLLLEVENGRPCQFFVNASGECAPYVSEAPEAVGAPELKKRQDAFIADNRIDVNDLSYFRAEGRRDYEALTRQLDFDSFDDAFYEDDSLYACIIRYARDNVDRIVL